MSRGKCKVKDCTKWAVQRGVCTSHGAKLRRCKIEGCDKVAKQGGVCISHGAKVKECSVETCTKKAKVGGMCAAHGASAKKCAFENCPKTARQGGVCVQHGARPRLCSIPGCDKHAKQGGLCVTHGAKVKRGRTKRTILITGASTPIGSATAVHLAKQRHRLFLIGTDRLRLEEVVKKCATMGLSTTDIVCGVGDMTNPIDVLRLCDEAARAFPRSYVEVAILHAEVSAPPHNIEDFSIEDFDRQFLTNVRGVFLFIKFLLPMMKQNRYGQIVVTSAVDGMTARPGAAIYSSTKCAIEGMISSLRLELRGSGVKAASVSPGQVSPWNMLKEPPTERSSMMDPRSVASAISTIVNQGSVLNIDQVVVE